MNRKKIQIDDSKCVGCGLCANTCQQSAIAMVDGKAKVIHEDYCDGIGNCLPVCPVGAISFSTNTARKEAQLRQWPIQIKLVPTTATYYDNAHLLIAADCTAFARENFHEDFMKEKITLIGCPKLDAGDYTDKLTDIIQNNNIQSITVVRMQVPCCRGIELATQNALLNSKKVLPIEVHIIAN